MNPTSMMADPLSMLSPQSLAGIMQQMKMKQAAQQSQQNAAPPPQFYPNTVNPNTPPWMRNPSEYGIWQGFGN